MNGSAVVLGINVGTDLVPVFQALASQRGLSREESREEIDNSSKDSDAKVVEAGRYSSTISLDGLYVPSQATFQVLLNKFRAGELIKARIVENNNPIEEASVLITNMTTEFPDSAEATISVSGTVSGNWYAVA